MKLIKPAVNLVLETSLVCDVGCKTCPASRPKDMASKIMSTEMADRIITHVKKSAIILDIHWFLYNEPLRLPNVLELVALGKKHRIQSILSSNLSNPRDLDGIMRSGLERLIISVSGWTQEVAERSHKGVNIDNVKRNMKRISELRPKGMAVQVSWHIYNYNDHEKQLMGDYAKELGFRFVPFCTSLLPSTLVQAMWEGAPAHKGAEDLVLNPMDIKKACEERKHWGCINQTQALVVNADGLIANCYNRASRDNLRGSIFDKTVPQVFKERLTDKDCIKCKASGLHIYATMGYTRGEYSLLRIGEALYRKLGLQGLCPAFGHFWRDHFYARPGKTAKDSL